MKVKHWRIHSKEMQDSKPSIRLSKGGCGLPDCKCSPGQWISICDGITGLTAHLEPKEMARIQKEKKMVEIHGEVEPSHLEVPRFAQKEEWQRFLLDHWASCPFIPDYMKANPLIYAPKFDEEKKEVEHEDG